MSFEWSTFLVIGFIVLLIVIHVSIAICCVRRYWNGPLAEQQRNDETLYDKDTGERVYDIEMDRRHSLSQQGDTGTSVVLTPSSGVFNPVFQHIYDTAVPLYTTPVMYYQSAPYATAHSNTMGLNLNGVHALQTVESSDSAAAPLSLPSNSWLVSSVPIQPDMTSTMWHSNYQVAPSAPHV